MKKTLPGYEKEYCEKAKTLDVTYVCWDDATDINPYELYENSEEISQFAFAG